MEEAGETCSVQKLIRHYQKASEVELLFRDPVPSELFACERKSSEISVFFRDSKCETQLRAHTALVARNYHCSFYERLL